MGWLEKLIDCGVQELEARRFLKYHDNNPEIWAAYEKEAFRLIASGYEYISSKGIFETLRHNPEIKKENKEFKVQNNHTPHYARVFVIKYPQHKSKFTFKACKAA
jgi:phosphorylcholine metabolism protein LicD